MWRNNAVGDVGVSRETHERLALFLDHLQRWNRRVNLVAKSDRDSLWYRHVADSLQLADLIRPAETDCLDIGTGAGFPGLVLAIATGKHFHLVEADTRKAAFLQEASRVTGAPTTVHATRVEALQVPQVSLVTARAVARLPKLVELAVRILVPGGHCLFLKGRSVQDELVDAEKLWHMKSERIASRTDSSGCVLHLSEITRGPSGS